MTDPFVWNLRLESSSPLLLIVVDEGKDGESFGEQEHDLDLGSDDELKRVVVESMDLSDAVEEWRVWRLACCCDPDPDETKAESAEGIR